MKIYLILGLTLSLAFSYNAFAYNSSLNETTAPFEKLLIEEKNIEEQREYLGELDGHPHIYEFSVAEETSFNLKLAQALDSDVAFSSILIRDELNDKAVKEIGRLKGSEQAWQIRDYKILGLKLKETEALQVELAPGTYRVEVSSPDNLGRYMLILGERDSATGYFKNISNIYQIQSFFGANAFQILRSSYVYFPIGISILIILIFLTCKNRQKFTIFKNVK